MGERVEALLRIPLAIVYGLILRVLAIVVGIVAIVQFFYTLILGERHRGLARFANAYSSFHFHVNRYLLFATNEKPLFDGPGWEEVLPCDFDRRERKETYEELREALESH